MPSSEKQSSSLTQVHRFSESVLHQEQISEASHIHVKTCACPTCKNKSESNQQWLADSPNGSSRNNQTGSIDPSLLISRAFGDITKAYLSGRETLNYYIYDQSINIQYLESELKTLEHQDDATQFINNLFLQLDPLIDLDFQATSNLDESDLTIISVDDWNAWTSDTVGQVVNLDFSWNVLWKDITQDSLRGNASGSNDSFDANTIIHEIGHALGLSHPNEDPFNSQWTTDDSVMSYNISPDGWDASFTDTDLDALQRIWGMEDDNVATNAAPALTGKKATLSEGREDLNYIIRAADLLQGYSDPNGDSLFVSELSASNGALSNNGDQSWTFAPTSNFNGQVDLNYSIDDGLGGSIASNQSFRITPINDIPVLAGKQASLSAGKENSAYTITEEDLLQGYSDPDGDKLFITNLSTSNGSLSKNDNRSWTLKPAKTFNGIIGLTYSIADGNGGSVNANNRFNIAPVKNSPAPKSEAEIAGGTDHPLMRGNGREKPNPPHPSADKHNQPIQALGVLDSENANIIQSKGKQANKIRGTQDNDYLLAGKGADILIGKGGADQFLFIKNDRFGRRGADTIKDFDIDEGDRLLLGARRLKGLDSDPTFATASRKKQLKKLTTKDTDVIYFKPRGELIYNQNSENPRFGRGGIFAVLENEPELSSEAFHFLAA